MSVKLNNTFKKRFPSKSYAVFKTVLHQASSTLFWINYCVHNVNSHSAGDWDCHPLDPTVWHVSISIVFQSYIAVMYQWQWIIAETEVV